MNDTSHTSGVCKAPCCSPANDGMDMDITEGPSEGMFQAEGLVEVDGLLNWVRSNRYEPAACDAMTLVALGGKR